ncbi:MAG: hypothetical protein QUU85_04420, partial [Candidatus Eisenbacteria bacterium]|nr:hypothetical protein [Candidatus Eisenbacteria bacterium]
MKAALLLLVLVVSVAHGASDRSLMVPAGPVGAAGAAPSYDAATDTWRPLEPPPCLLYTSDA